jgi:hypothetical protein
VPKIIGTKVSRIVAVVVGLMLLYGAAGFALAPRLLRSALLDHIPKQTGATA